jgi:CRP-like cAMP-binding protein
LPVFKNLQDAEIADIVRIFKIEQKQDGQILCNEGDPGDCMYIVESGAVQISKKTEQGDLQVLATINAPTVVGEMALLDGAPRSATVKAVGSTQLYRIDRLQFGVLRNNWSTAAYKVIFNLATILCARLRSTNEKIDQFFQDPETALAKMKNRQNELWQRRQASRRK